MPSAGAASTARSDAADPVSSAWRREARVDIVLQFQPVRISGILRNESNVDLKAVDAAFFYNGGTRDKPSRALIEKRTLSLKKGEEAAVSCSWKVRGSNEHWTDISFVADPDDAIKEQVENAAHHEAATSIVVRK